MKRRIWSHDLAAARRAALLGAGVVLGLAPAMSARADRLFYKNGKSLEGLIKSEHPSTIYFIFQGREMRIPRDRVDHIERGDPMENFDLMLTKAKEALDSGDVPQARELLNQAREMAPTGDRQARLAGMDADVKKALEMGNSDERHKKASAMLKEAGELLDRVEMQKGAELLLKALEMEPAMEEAHDLMAKFMKDRKPSTRLASDYFSDRVLDPGKLKPDHPIIKMLPEIYVDEVVGLQKTDNAEQITSHIHRLKKISKTFDEHPEWAKTGSESQKALIDMRVFGIVSREIEKDFGKSKFDRAELRLRALGEPTDNPAMAKLYIRAYVAGQHFDQAKALLEAQRAGSTDTAWIDQSVNALDFYLKADEAKKAGNGKDARAVLDRLFQSRDKLKEIPEIFKLVAAAKVEYDLTLMESLEDGGEAMKAADLAAQVHSYALDKESRKKAAEVFARLAPNLAYKYAPTLSFDGVEVPMFEEWTAKTQAAIAGKYNLKFDEASPFTLTVRIAATTTDNSGPRVLEAAKQADTLTVDFLPPPDTGVNKMKIEVVVAHPAEPSLFDAALDHAALPAPIQAAREGLNDLRHQKGDIKVFDLTQISDIGRWLEGDFIAYFPPEMEKMGAGMVLKEKEEEKEE